MKKSKSIVVVLFFLFFGFQGCGVYSFTGASIPAEAKTVSIQYFPNNALIVNPMLSSELTNALRDRFMTQTSLDLIDGGGDLAFEGEVTDYSTTPVAIQSNQTAGLNRLSISVNVRFFNKFDESKNFETRFSAYEDYPSEQDLNAVQSALIATIIERLVDDIFNRSVVNW